MRQRISLLMTITLLAGLGFMLVWRVTAQTFTTLHGFTALNNSTNSDGAVPYGGLIISSNTLYGTAFGGGSSGNGTVFAINTDGTGFTNLYNFTGVSDGANLRAGLILSSNTLYGTASAGGSKNKGTVFAINTDGSGFTNLHSFNPQIPQSDGSDPRGNVVLSGNTLYGTTYDGGGTAGNGRVFAVNTDATGFTNLYKFAGGNDGAHPWAGLILSGNCLRGMTYRGGSSGWGTVFAVNTDGTGFTNLHSFASTSSDGASPYDGLILSGNTLYGTTAHGGNSGVGTVFAINTDGTGFTNLYSFTGSQH